jgi:hypothetical protein
MTRKVPLNNVDHADLKVVVRHAAAFGDSVNQMLIFPTEFEEVQREFPIFFRKDANGDFQSVALLGLDRDENLFLGEGGWESRYIPAVQQRGPFSIGLREQQVDGESVREPVIHVDLDDSRISRAEGRPIFLPQGGNSPYLDHVSRALRAIHAGLEVSKPMFAAFAALDLIEPVAVEIELGDNMRYDLPNHHTIGQDRLAQLDGAGLERLHQAGFLRAAFLVTSSLQNVNRLIELKNRKRAAGAGVRPNVMQESGS